MWSSETEVFKFQISCTSRTNILNIWLNALWNRGCSFSRGQKRIHSESVEKKTIGELIEYRELKFCCARGREKCFQFYGSSRWYWAPIRSRGEHHALNLYSDQIIFGLNQLTESDIERPVSSKGTHNEEVYENISKLIASTYWFG